MKRCMGRRSRDDLVHMDLRPDPSMDGGCVRGVGFILHAYEPLRLLRRRHSGVQKRPFVDKKALTLF